MNNQTVIVVGAGASGLLAAGFAARRGLAVTLVERNDRPARKVMITGKGRCNVTNRTGMDELIASVPRNGRFLYSAFSAFTPENMMQLLTQQGVALKIERGNRVFPVSDKAVDIVDALTRFAYSGNVKQVKGRVTSLLIQDSALRGVCLESGEQLYGDAVIVATGGLSYPQTGSTGDGYTLAMQAGHTIVPVDPSLVPLCVHEGFVSQLQGLSLKNTALRVWDTKKQKVIYDDFGEMLFTHFGISGPMVLSASAHLRPMEPQRYQILIDCKPALDSAALDARLQRDFAANSNRDFINALSALLPHKLIPVMVRLSGIPPHEKVNQITREQRQVFAALLKELRLTVTGFRPVEEAIVTSGGVKVSEVVPSTMESKLLKNLYFAGEVLDVDAYTGGFNLQIAFSTGCAAGKNVLQ